ncbi:EamA family transporter [Limosilactobacillus sp.]|jgi:drug/metabolite transporter (DMT)-like permease|uniref:EamA family transporter n=1 Tax=Limosilactobacillus sp. TaxID=2773925 RepID=UPI0025BD8DEB|nr:DMT family transporter [Limosilactobacillus sp.]MCH3922249.1 DMT family transporter [Limosilactobacillus sp.]MCH3929021.1 DMT family transporter [Limosilactobacillus sp.]
MTNKKVLGTVMIIVACTFWGISGLFAKALFNASTEITSMWVTQTRMISAGIILLIISQFKGDQPFKIFKNLHDAWVIFAYGFFGLVPVQYGYFMAVQFGNASIATVLQFLGPFFIIAYVAVFRHIPPRRIEIISALIAFAGVFILATHGQLNHMAITPLVLFWGLVAAVGVATNTLIPQQMLRTNRVPSLVVTGWGLLFAGLSLLAIHPAQPHVPNLPIVWICWLGILVIGTLIPFQLANNSLKYIDATTFSLMDAFEPLAATIGSVLLFNLHMTGMDIVGSILVIVAVLAINIRIPQHHEGENIA